MKIGFLIDDHMDRPGGVQEYVRGLGRFLCAAGHEVVVFSSGGDAGAEASTSLPDRPGASTSLPDRPGGPVRSLPDRLELRIVALGRPLALRGSGSSTSIPITWHSPASLRRTLAREACDVLHVMAPYSPTLSGRLLVRSRALHVLTFLVAIEPGRYRALLSMLARLQWRSLGTIARRIAISEAAEATGRALYGGTYRMIPCGVETSRFVPLHDRPPAPAVEATILCVGRLEQRKGVAHLLRAFALLAPTYRQLRLVIGGDGPERRALEQLAASLGVNERVSFLGYVAPAQLPRVLAAADIFCAPATYAESFGIVLIEAMASGLPIVAAANAGYAGLLAAHPGNLLAPPGDHRAMAGALAALLDAPTYRRRLGQRNHIAAGRYAWPVVGQQILDLYHVPA